MSGRTGYICACALLIALVVATWFQFRVPGAYVSEEFLMDTLVSIKAYGKDEETLKKGVHAAFAEMRRIAELADGFPGEGTDAARASDVCRINSRAGKLPVRVQADTMAMLVLAQRYSELSRGAFDVTVGPLMELWGFGGKTPRLPEPERLSAALALVGNRDLVLDRERGTAFLRRAGMKIDLGAVAKGYATESALRVLQRHGIDQALIDAGGNVRVLGLSPRGGGWSIGIRDPRNAEAVAAVLKLEDASAVTSGDYQRGFEEGGKRYHHILDPRTGYPAAHNASVTVVTRDAGLADVLSTMFFVLPPDRALEFAGAMERVELVLIGADGRIRHSASLGDRIQLKAGGKPTP